MTFEYAHAQGTVPADAARITDGKGQVWALSTVRAVPTGFYLWGRVDQPTTFATLAQIASTDGLPDDMATAGQQAQIAQFKVQDN